MKIETAKRKHEKRLMRLPNVIGVGIGEKAGRKVIKVYVTRKGVAIPKSIEGWRTDVEVVGVIEAQIHLPGEVGKKSIKAFEKWVKGFPQEEKQLRSPLPRQAFYHGFMIASGIWNKRKHQ